VLFSLCPAFRQILVISQVVRMDEEIKQNQKRNTEMRKQLEEWKQKYFALYLKLNEKKD
jgi:hypothetical protein